MRTHVEPMRALEAKPEAARNLAANVRRAAQREFRFYKGLGDERIVERTLAYLDACGDETVPRAKPPHTSSGPPAYQASRERIRRA